MSARQSKKPKNALEAVRKAPMRAAWEPHMARVFNAPNDMIPPASILLSKAPRGKVATYKARFTGTTGPDMDIVVRIRLLAEGGGEIVGRDIRMVWKTGKVSARRLKSPPWVHTSQQLIADLRDACQTYRLNAYGARQEIEILRARIAEMQAGIGAAMLSLETNVDHDVVWFSLVETLWEYLGAVRDPDGDLGPPVAVVDPVAKHAYDLLPRDPETGRPVIL